MYLYYFMIIQICIQFFVICDLFIFINKNIPCKITMHCCLLALMHVKVIYWITSQFSIRSSCHSSTKWHFWCVHTERVSIWSRYKCLTDCIFMELVHWYSWMKYRCWRTGALYQTLWSSSKEKCSTYGFLFITIFFCLFLHAPKPHVRGLSSVYWFDV